MAANQETVLLSISFTQYLDQYEEQLKRITNFNKADREGRLAKCRELDTDILETRQNFIRELRGIPNGDEKKHSVEDLKQHIERYRLLKQEYEKKHFAINPEDSDPEEKKEVQHVNPEENYEQKFEMAAKMGDDLQDKTAQAIQRMQADVTHAEIVAHEANQRMDEQMNQMERIGHGFDQIGGAAKQAKRETRKLASAMCRDKFIISFTLLDIVLIVTIILIYSLWHVNDKSQTTTTTTTTVTTIAPVEHWPQHLSNLRPVYSADYSDLYMMQGLIDDDNEYLDEQRNDQRSVITYEPRYPDMVGSYVGFFEGVQRWIECAGGDPNQYSIINNLIPFSLRGKAFGAVDFSHFEVNDGGSTTCNHVDMGVMESFGGYRMMVRAPHMIDWT